MPKLRPLSCRVIPLLLLAATPCAAAIEDSSLTVVRVDGSEIVAHVTRQVAEGPIPMVLAIDGSVCLPSRLNASMPRLAPPQDGLPPYALVTVEKPGVEAPEPEADGSIRIGPDFECPDEFKTRYSVDRRILDHLRVLQILRRDAEWWDGRLFLWGFSEGASVATRVAAFAPETRRIVLGGMGGGVPMAEELADAHICAEGNTDDRPACLRELRAQLDAIRENPTAAESWLGDANTWRAWASRIDGVEANILADLTVPVLLFHGTEDGSTPVSSARRAAELLSRPGGPPFEYREIEGMGHGLGSRLGDRIDDLHAELLGWLVGSPAEAKEETAAESPDGPE